MTLTTEDFEKLAVVSEDGTELSLDPHSHMTTRSVNDRWLDITDNDIPALIDYVKAHHSGRKVRLALFHPEITDLTFERLRDLPNLTALNIWCDITDAATAHLQCHTGLEQLKLNNPAMLTDAGLETIGSFSQLRILDLAQNTHITDAGLAHIAKLPKLEILDLDYAEGITDAGLKYLEKAPALHIVLTYGTQATEQGTEALYEALAPNNKRYQDALQRERAERKGVAGDTTRENGSSGQARG
jgi:hypothetical protein